MRKSSSPIPRRRIGPLDAAFLALFALAALGLLAISYVGYQFALGVHATL